MNLSMKQNMWEQHYKLWELKSTNTYPGGVGGLELDEMRAPSILLGGDVLICRLELITLILLFLVGWKVVDLP